MIALSRPVGLLAGAGAVLGLLVAWTLYQRHDAVSDYKAEIAERNAIARQEHITTARENRDNVETLDDGALRDAIPQRLPDEPAD
ncbi:MAG: hypothetical protein AAGI09_11840 [Pseudomonadota bacterium]